MRERLWPQGSKTAKILDVRGRASQGACMNRSLPPGDCGDRIVVAGRTSGHRGPLYGACGLVDGTEAAARRPNKESRRGGTPVAGIKIRAVQALTE